MLTDLPMVDLKGKFAFKSLMLLRIDCICWFGDHSLPLNYRLMNKIVALKEIHLQLLEGTPFTAIREGKYIVLFILFLEFSVFPWMSFVVSVCKTPSFTFSCLRLLTMSTCSGCCSQNISFMILTKKEREPFTKKIFLIRQSCRAMKINTVPSLSPLSFHSLSTLFPLSLFLSLYSLIHQFSL